MGVVGGVGRGVVGISLLLFMHIIMMDMSPTHTTNMIIIAIITW
jgi:hypothetical protein